MTARGTIAAAAAGHCPPDPPPPPPPPASDPIPALDVYPDRGQGTAIVTLIGGPGEPAQYRVGLPLPIDLIVGGQIYNLSDRAAGTYTFRH